MRRLQTTQRHAICFVCVCMGGGLDGLPVVGAGAVEPCVEAPSVDCCGGVIR